MGVPCKSLAKGLEDAISAMSCSRVEPLFSRRLVAVGGGIIGALLEKPEVLQLASLISSCLVNMLVETAVVKTCTMLRPFYSSCSTIL